LRVQIWWKYSLWHKKSGSTIYIPKVTNQGHQMIIKWGEDNTLTERATNYRFCWT